MKTESLLSQKDRFSQLLHWSLGIGVLIRIGLWGIVAFTNPVLFMADDSYTYYQNALSIMQLGTFSESPDTPEKPETFRTPGYPAFLAAVYTIFGKNPIAAVAVQLVISFLSMILLYSIANRLWGTRIACVATAFFALDVGMITYSTFLLTETLFTLLLLCMMATFIPILRERETRLWPFLCGFFLALATFVRPVGYYLSFFILIALLIHGTVRKRGWKTFRVAACFAVPLVILIGSWQLRNYILTGHAIFTRLLGHQILMKAAEVVGIRDQVPVDVAVFQLQRKMADKVDPLSGNKSKEELDRISKQEGIQYLKQYPLFFVRKQAARAVRMLAPAGLSMFVFFGTEEHGWPLGDLRRLSFNEIVRKWVVGRPLSLIVSLFMFTHLMLIYTGGAISLWQWFRKRHVGAIHLFYAVVFLYFLAVSLAIGFKSRFLLPALPVLYLYTAKAFSRYFSPQGIIR